MASNDQRLYPYVRLSLW